MTDKPIIFSGPMVRAILDGRKTQTRRVLKPQPPQPIGINYDLGNESWIPVERRSPVRRIFEYWSGPLFHARPEGHLCGHFESISPYQPSDRMWVREAWRTHKVDDDLSPSALPPNARIWFEEEPGKDNADYIGRYRHARHMCRGFSRLTLYVTAVKVERLQEIGGYDAYWEGVCQSKEGHDGGHPSYTIMEFQRIWNSINAKRPGCAWEDNPWVCAVTFEPRLGNIDDLPDRLGEAA